MKTVQVSKKGWIVSEDGVSRGYGCLVQGATSGRRLLYTWEALAKMHKYGLDQARAKGPDHKIERADGTLATLAEQLIEMGRDYRESGGPGVIVIRRGHTVQ